MASSTDSSSSDFFFSIFQVKWFFFMDLHIGGGIFMHVCQNFSTRLWTKEIYRDIVSHRRSQHTKVGWILPDLKHRKQKVT